MEERSSSATDPPLTFLGLPTELRVMVYEWLLSDKVERRTTEFLPTCRKIYNEASDVLYGKKQWEIGIKSFDSYGWWTDTTPRSDCPVIVKRGPERGSTKRISPMFFEFVQKLKIVIKGRTPFTSLPLFCENKHENEHMHLEDIIVEDCESVMSALDLYAQIKWWATQLRVSSKLTRLEIEISWTGETHDIAYRAFCDAEMEILEPFRQLRKIADVTVKSFGLDEFRQYASVGLYPEVMLRREPLVRIRCEELESVMKSHTPVAVRSQTEAYDLRAMLEPELALAQAIAILHEKDDEELNTLAEAAEDAARARDDLNLDAFERCIQRIVVCRQLGVCRAKRATERALDTIKQANRMIEELEYEIEITKQKIETAKDSMQEAHFVIQRGLKTERFVRDLRYQQVQI
ncbi:hypothetical protein K402DRAFT_459356 [Aulographum hederae CBS 113979]|uniref:Uncharacterized protein n=1 Tax=Aulographum hederae CBS 113979 TaxID=1176131 RepID=A0A6G1HE52_9PEZI|nr:hypothetical protein K402DRAFT_459356 [Aulographum hederae CBS 113979]